MKSTLQPQFRPNIRTFLQNNPLDPATDETSVNKFDFSAMIDDISCMSAFLVVDKPLPCLTSCEFPCWCDITQFLLLLAIIKDLSTTNPSSNWRPILYPVRRTPLAARPE